MDRPTLLYFPSTSPQPTNQPSTQAQVYIHTADRWSLDWIGSMLLRCWSFWQYKHQHRPTLPTGCVVSSLLIGPSPSPRWKIKSQEENRVANTNTCAVKSNATIQWLIDITFRIFSNVNYVYETSRFRFLLQASTVFKFTLKWWKIYTHIKIENYTKYNTLNMTTVL